MKTPFVWRASIRGEPKYFLLTAPIMAIPDQRLRLPVTGGVLLPPKAYLQGVRELANEFGIVLILDEVMAGFGRTGRWFAFEHYDMAPDLIVFAKGVNSGCVPAGGVGVFHALESVSDPMRQRVLVLVGSRVHKS